MKSVLIIGVSVLVSVSPTFSETVVAVRTIRAQQMIMPADVQQIADTLPGMATDLEDVIGLEARNIIYSGRPISMSEIGPAALIERNQIVSLIFQRSGLTIRTDGRSLSRGGKGDLVRVINLDSRKTVSGKIDDSGSVWVTN